MGSDQGPALPISPHSEVELQRILNSTLVSWVIMKLRVLRWEDVIIYTIICCLHLPCLNILVTHYVGLYVYHCP